MPKFGAKKCLICLFLCKIFKKPLSYLKSEPSNFSNCKVLRRNKNAYIWDKKSLIWVFSTNNLGVFWLEFDKNTVIFETSTVKFV